MAEGSKSRGARALAGRTALVTGAGRRVGKAIAAALAREGADLAVHYNSSESGARETAEEARTCGVQAVPIRADLSYPGQVERLFAEVKGRLGGPDILVNSAALFERIPFAKLDLDAWERTQRVNLTAPFLCCKAAVPEMRARGGGDIVNICDIGGMAAWKGFCHYNVSKAGLIMLTRALAVELAPEIRVNGVAPGTVLFPEDYDESARARLESRIPMGRAGTPEDVAAAVLFFVSGSGYVTGQVLAVDGGRSARDVTGG
jgi:pteridine reductase